MTDRRASSRSARRRRRRGRLARIPWEFPSPVTCRNPADPGNAACSHPESNPWMSRRLGCLGGRPDLLPLCSERVPSPSPTAHSSDQRDPPEGHLQPRSPSGAGDSPVATPSRSSRAGADQSTLIGEDHGLHAVPKTELCQNAADVALHGPLGQEETTCDLGVGQTSGD
jgi:hypothetical protein